MKRRTRRPYKPPTPTIKAEPPTPSITAHEEWRLRQAQPDYPAPAPTPLQRAWQAFRLPWQLLGETGKGVVGSLFPGRDIWGGQTGDWRRHLAQVQRGLQPYGFAYGPTWGQPGGFLGGPAEQLGPFGPSGMVNRKSARVAAQLLAIGRGERERQERPELDVGPGYYPGGYGGYGYPIYRGGGGGYPRYSLGAAEPRGLGLGRIMGASRRRGGARSHGLVVWRI